MAALIWRKYGLSSVGDSCGNGCEETAINAASRSAFSWRYKCGVTQRNGGGGVAWYRLNNVAAAAMA